MNLALHQRVCVWLGLAFFPLFAAGLLVAGWLPPPSPNTTAAAVAQMYAEHRSRIRIGVWILTAASPLLAFYGAALSHHIRRTLGPTPLATAQSLAAACLILEFIFPQLIWQAAAFRPDRNPELVLLFHDVGWLLYMGVVGTAMVQMAICAVAILLDPRPQPLAPRWAAYVCAWTALGVAGGSFCVFTQTGPVAWNGIIAFWLLAVSFFIWMVTMSTFMITSTRRPDAEPAQ
ncbi:hypothetical protein BOO86_15680 [Mycobacterium sp. CBMA 234]|uniref:hypothetical protein n=1 Tax=Mycolicibacterium sp. CBMA 234 TaxID=1918495 RepID=UPI001391BB15|nr:hypothetical protein [Mycolicibacterium sp. CBMA 234]MUL65916.1 hypothetical protein [Mycolicibacterium sp. CBMA 234]